MQYLIFGEQDYLQVSLPEFTSTELVRGDAITRGLESDIVVDTVTAFAIFITEAAKHGKDIAEVAKDGIKGVKEWAEILKHIPALVPVLIRFYHGVVKNAEEFYTAVKDMTPTQKEKSIAAFVANFDLANDKAELAVEHSVKMILEVINLIKFFR